jgi:hypothetical protein
MMKAVQFLSQITSDGKINVPDKILKELSDYQNLQIIILVQDKNNQQEDNLWYDLAAEQLLSGYEEKV